MESLDKHTQYLKLQKLQPADTELFSELISLFTRVFGEEAAGRASDTHLQKLLQNPSFHVFVALTGEKVAGGLTAYELPQYHTEKPELYIYDLAVAPEQQRRGIGKQLIAAISDYGRQQGFKTLFVQAYSDEEQAVSFYRPIFGKPDKTDHFSIALS